MLDFKIQTLGKATIANPLLTSDDHVYVKDDFRMLANPYAKNHKLDRIEESFEIAGPRDKIYFEPQNTTAVMVTCGGLCPGLNAVIRGITFQLWHRYKVRKILGVKYGYQGFKDPVDESIVELNPGNVVDIHEQGGTILGSSRGTPGVKVIVDRLVELNADILFAIGGDGTLKGASAIADEAESRGLKLSVIGIPKTIDNDIPWVKQSFGFETAVELASDVVIAAHAEAKGARNGIGLVKLMGRHSGYIAANAAMVTGHVNYCLVPEVPFALDGEGGLLSVLEKRLAQAGHAVIVVAEGAGQELFEGKGEARDKSGNLKLQDIGLLLKEKISNHFIEKDLDFTLKYLDPSYYIRAAAACSSDRLFCARLARNAVHAGMSGKTKMLVGFWHGRTTHLPFSALEGRSQTIKSNGEIWFNVIESTGQPLQIK